MDLLRETVKVSLDSAPETQKCYHNCEICVLRNGKGSREGIEIPTERPERYVEEKEEEFIAPVISRHFEAEEPTETPAPVRERPREEGSESKNRRRHRGGRRRSGGSGEGTPNTSAPAKKEAPKAPEGQSRQGGKPANRSQRPKQDRPRTERPKQDQRPKQDAAPAREKVKLLSAAVTGADAAIAAVAAETPAEHPPQNKRLSQAERESFRSAVF